MKRLNKNDLKLQSKTITDLNNGSGTATPASPPPTSKLDCITWTSCATECEQGTCPGYSDHLRTCDETFATKCLCGDSKNCGDTLGCGTKSGGALCCDTGATCDNCGPLSQGNCESVIQVCETKKDFCIVETEFCQITTKQDTCAIEYTKDNIEDGDGCIISLGIGGCIIQTKNVMCRGDI